MILFVGMPLKTRNPRVCEDPGEGDKGVFGYTVYVPLSKAMTVPTLKINRLQNMRRFTVS